MISKVTQGADGRALIRYLFGPGKANEHTNQRIVTSGIVMGVEEGRLLTPQEISDLGAALDAANDMYRANPAGGHIWHLSLSLPVADRRLSDDQWGMIAQNAIQAIGFEREGMRPAAWVAVAHGTSAIGNQHIHIAATLVRVDGSRVDTWQSKRVLSRVCAALEVDYGLVVVEGREGKGMPGLSRAELERTAREQRLEPPRIALARLVRAASVASRDEAEFVRRVRGSGVLVRPRFETGGKEAVIGYSVAFRTKDGVAPIWFGGGRLAKDLTLPNLRRFWLLSPDDSHVAVREWSAVKSLSPGREAVAGSPDDWHRAAAGIEKALERLREVPASDLGAWRGAARETAGVLAAWSRRFEGDSPGPMARAADLLARSAQSPPGDPAPNREAMNFRGIAAIVAQSQLNSNSPMAWSILIEQLGRTLRAIGDAGMARGEAQMSKGLVEDLSHELKGLHDRFKTISLRELASHERIAKTVPSWYKVRESHGARHRRPGPSHDRGFGR
jgi:relaxase-like protein